MDQVDIGAGWALSIGYSRTPCWLTLQAGGDCDMAEFPPTFNLSRWVLETMVSWSTIRGMFN